MTKDRSLITEQKVALITSASSGIGRVTTELLKSCVTDEVDAVVGEMFDALKELDFEKDATGLRV
jgi:NADP-dependent 3-hydroxy acid dehydrogenase YdfG